MESKNPVSSSSMISGYQRIRSNQMQAGIRLEDLAQEKVQRVINQTAKEKSLKTVINATAS